MKKIAVLLALVLAVCSCAYAETDMEYVKAKGTLVVGITDFKPMDYKNEKGEWIGFDADLA
ncbi:MAG: ABC transporter substrate-binding protein, partial [Synergistaceae bacterium]|nr:ABC transporter substrate-binding protein [Synergistaceae bacterium]